MRYLEEASSTGLVYDSEKLVFDVVGGDDGD